MTMKGFTFASWLAVRNYCETHAWVYYQAPLDYRPSVVAVRRVFKNGKIRLVPPSGFGFTADAGHLGRFSYPD